MNPVSGVCDRTSNNKFFNCPPRMSDGRHFTDYRPSSYVNDLIRYSNNVMSNFEYKQFLIDNAEELINLNNKYTYQKNGCSPCNAENIQNQTNCVLNQSTSKCLVNNENGLGIGYTTEFNKEIPYNPNLREPYCPESSILTLNNNNK